jgi:transcriptional regulator with XRE-family HTH domain
METGKLIKELRIKKGITQEVLAELTELSARTIQRIENGEVDARAYTLQMIAKALDVDFELFVENETDEGKETQMVINNNWIVVLHLSGIIPLIFPTILLWNLKKDKIKGITNHYRAIISFQLMVFGIILGCLWVYWKVNMLMPLIGILLANALFTLMNTLRVMNGEAFMHPVFKKNQQQNPK